MELILIQLGLALGKQLLSTATQAKWPQTVLDAIGETVTAIETHHNDVVSKAALDAQRG